MQPSHSETAAQLAALQAFAASDNLMELQRLAAGGATAKRQSLRDFAASDYLAELELLAAEAGTAKFQSLRDFAASTGLAELRRMMCGEKTAAHQTLRDFAANPDLAWLHALIDESKIQPASFDLFEVLGIHRQEAVHSNFLRWLLNPAQNHGVGDYFLKNFLLATTDPTDPTASAKVAAADWSKAIIHLEWHAIVDGVNSYLDILIVNPQAQILCAIENKIFSPEGFGADGRSQLTRYREGLEHAYPGFARQYVFLSPDGMPSQSPSEQALWTPANYTTIRKLVEQTLDHSANAISDEVRVFLQQYADTLRRNIVPESTEIQQLARQIYLERRETVELIYANKPNYVNEAKQIFKEAIAAHEGWELDREDTNYVRFRSADWDEFPATRTGTGWMPQSPALLLFQFGFQVANPNPSFVLALSPGPDEAVREKLFDVVRQNPALFRPTGNVLRPDWNILHEEQERILDDSDYGISWDDGSARAKIMAWVADFAQNQFPSMNEVILNCLREYEAAPASAPEPGQ